LGASLPGHAVQLNTDGHGQALIYPYYTVRAAPDGNAFNTYLSVVNTTTQAKAVRVRLREGRIGRAVLDFNLYLSPNDVWAGALVPTATGAQLLTTDRSCTDPEFATASGSTRGLPLHSNNYTGASADGFGDTLDRTREGYVEIIEMGTLSGAAAAAVSHNSAGVPNNCAAMRAMTAPTVARPSGGLWGTLTLINVNSGQDFTLDAVALEALASRPFFRPPGDPYPDFNAAEIDPVSVRIAHGHLYRSVWTRPADAGERRAHALPVAGRVHPGQRDKLAHRHGRDAAHAPLPHGRGLGFTAVLGAPGLGLQQGDRADRVLQSRGTRRHRVRFGFPGIASDQSARCALRQRRRGDHPQQRNPPAIASSRDRRLRLDHAGLAQRVDPDQRRLPERLDRVDEHHLAAAREPVHSTRTNLATGQVATASHAFAGLPVVGFTARTFANGTLRCGAGSCQGNYGGAFNFRYSEPLARP
jgi:hypothetical protein